MTAISAISTREAVDGGGWFRRTITGGRWWLKRWRALMVAVLEDDSGGETPTPGEGETLYEDAVCVDANAGEFCMELLPEVAPNTVKQFPQLHQRAVVTMTPSSIANCAELCDPGRRLLCQPPGNSSVPRDAAVVNEFELIQPVRGTVAMARLRADRLTAPPASGLLTW